MQHRSTEMTEIEAHMKRFTREQIIGRGHARNWFRQIVLDDDAQRAEIGRLVGRYRQVMIEDGLLSDCGEITEEVHEFLRAQNMDVCIVQLMRGPVMIFETDSHAVLFKLRFGEHVRGTNEAES